MRYKPDPCPLQTFLVTAVVLLGILVGGGCNDNATAPDNGGIITPPPSCPSTYVQQVVDLINLERVQADLPPLAVDVRLAAAAQDHADYMAANNAMSHTGEGGSSPADRAAAAGFPMVMLGENVAAGQDSPAAVVIAWMNSPGHRANILHESFRLIGAGYGQNPASLWRHYWVNVFGVASDGGLVPENGCHP